eukprot:76203-Prymnesium_polylepis.2
MAHASRPNETNLIHDDARRPRCGPSNEHAPCHNCAASPAAAACGAAPGYTRIVAVTQMTHVNDGPGSSYCLRSLPSSASRRAVSAPPHPSRTLTPRA